MSRESQSNTFNDGMVKDLHPLLTPNTVMTDCLNGTIVTYNGNEYALQNDLGNYKFEHGNLKPGFVPIGIKEHANTLYIVSYNPISNEVEIGSFPSFKTVFYNEIEGDNISNDINLKNIFNYYSNLSPNLPLTFLTNFTDTYKINPGDKYLLYNDSSNNKYDPEITKNHYYIMSKDQQLYDISNSVSISNKNDAELLNVGWDVPGWLAIQKSINVMDSFRCFIKSVVTSGTNSDNSSNENNENQEQDINTEDTSNDEVVGQELDSNVLDDDSKENTQTLMTVTISMQSIWPLNTDINTISDNLGYFVYCYDDENEKSWNELIKEPDTEGGGIDWSKESNWELYRNKSVEYDGLYKVIHSTIDIETDKKNIKVVPVLRTKEIESQEERFVIIDQFSDVLRLKSNIWDVNTIHLGDNVFKYIVNDKSIDIYFDVDLGGAEAGKLSYIIKDLSGNVVEESKEIKSITNGLIENIRIDFTDPFNKEDVYIIDFTVTDKNNKNGVTVSKNLYASEVVNYYQDKLNNYDSSDFDFIEAMNNYLKVTEEWETEKIVDFNGESLTQLPTIEECKTKIIKGYYSTLPKYSTSIDSYNKEYKISLGTKYKLKKLDINWPKDQTGNKTGKMWSDYVASEWSAVFKVSENGLESNDISLNNINNTIELTHDSTTTTTTTMDTDIQVPKNSKTFTNNWIPGQTSSFVSEDKKIFVGGVRKSGYKFNHGALMWKTGTKGANNFYCGKWSSTGDEFRYYFEKDKDDESLWLNVYISNSWASFKYTTKGWIQDGNNISKDDVEKYLENKFVHQEMAYSGTEDHSAVTCSSVIKGKLGSPALVSFWNNMDLDILYKLNGNTTGLKFPNIMTDTNMDGLIDDGAGRMFFALAIPNASGSDGNYFSILLPYGYVSDTYVLDTFLHYLCMAAFIKYSDKSEYRTYYKPETSTVQFNTNEKNISKPNYYITVKLPNFGDRIIKLDIKNNNYSNDLTSKVKDFFDENGTTSKELENSEKFEDLKAFEKELETIAVNQTEIYTNNKFPDSIEDGSIYVDNNCSDSILSQTMNNIAKKLQWRNNRFAYNDTGAVSGSLKMRHSKGDYSQVCIVYNINNYNET